jgi:para-aminobenzoate synthetase component 1
MSRLACHHLLEEIDSPLAAIDYYAAHAHEEHGFLLDSGRDPEKLGRYSFVGRRPFLVFRSKGDRIEIQRAGGALEQRRGNPFEELRRAFEPYRVDPALYAGSEIPFLGGAVGYFGYELNYVLEKLPCRGADDLALPDCYFMFFDAVIVRDERERRVYLSALGFDADPAAARARARETFATLRAEMERVERGPASGAAAAPAAGSGAPGPGGAELKIRSMFTQEAYMDVVRQAKEHILAGDIFEVCTTHRLECDFAGDAFALYRELRRINPAPFASYLNLPEVEVVCSSPERFLRLDRAGRAESRPIKGTRPRGRDEAEDKVLHDDLFSSIKDRAENMMIVDLVRNDLGRVCEFHSVRVPELMVIERYATVFQMVSTIVGQLEPGRDVFDLVQACFPGGSMTGAPKIEAMTIIDALEPVKRGIYSGSIGYLDFAGNADLNIVIRTILVRDGKAYFQVGGAVVADSDPEAEYLETLHKARALIRALQSVVEGRDPAEPVDDVRGLVG